ncbi:MAG: response regulator [Bacillota bacterium]
MYKLIIVDDEDEVRQGILQNINWEKYGFQVAGEAENGREALDHIEKEVPDLVITDIKMPVMDGLELSSILKESFPTVKIVIITGFDDFKYAQQAIKYGVLEYILKPVLPKDIEDLLERLKRLLDEEHEHNEDIKRLKEHYNNSLPVMRDKFLTSLITGKLKEAEIESKVRNFDLKLLGKIFMAAVIGIDNNSLKQGNFESEDTELISFAVFNIADEIVKKHSAGEVFIYPEHPVVITCFDSGDNSAAYRRTFSILEEIRQSVEKYLKFTITIGLGNACDSAGMLGESYKSALTALDYRLLIGNNKVIYIDDVEPQPKNNILFDEEKERALLTAIKFGTEDDINSAIDMLFKDLMASRVSLKDYQVFLLELVASILKISKSLQLDSKNILNKDGNLMDKIFGSGTSEEVIAWIKEICINLANSILSMRQNTCKLLLDKAKEYIKENYSDQEISINKVSSHLHISPSYLSLIFKKETGETFLNYLIRIRLEAAEGLLMNTSLKTSEIAKRIGYSDPHYFSYFFKRNFGVSPREFRNSLNK